MSDNDGEFGKKLSMAIAQGLQVVVVHGGGPQINAALAAAGIESSFVGGFRVTTPETFDVVEEVLSNQVGPEVASTLTKSGVAALAISGRHSGTLFAHKQTQLVDGTAADLGLVGEVERVDVAAIDVLLEKKVTPVISPIANDVTGDGGLNVNADIAAGASKTVNQAFGEVAAAWADAKSGENKVLVGVGMAVGAALWGGCHWGGGGWGGVGDGRRSSS